MASKIEWYRMDIDAVRQGSDRPVGPSIAEVIVTDRRKTLGLLASMIHDLPLGKSLHYPPKT